MPKGVVTPRDVCREEPVSRQTAQWPVQQVPPTEPVSQLQCVLAPTKTKGSRVTTVRTVADPKLHQMPVVNLTKMSQMALKSLPAQNRPEERETGTPKKGTTPQSQHDNMEVDPDDDMSSITIGLKAVGRPSTKAESACDGAAMVTSAP